MHDDKSSQARLCYPNFIFFLSYKNIKNARHINASVQVSKIRYLSHRGDKLAASLNTRTSLALGLDLDGSPLPAENYQLMNYGIGRWRWL